MWHHAKIIGAFNIKSVIRYTFIFDAVPLGRHSSKSFEIAVF